MRSVSYRLADLIKARIPLGFVGENEHTVVQFDAKQAFDQYPTATPSLTVKNPSGEKYPAVVVRDGDMVIWTISDSDLIVPGRGEFQLQFKEGDTVMRSYVGETRIERSIMPTGNVPTPVQNWIDAAEDVLEEVEEAIPAGGTTGQVLAKKTNADRDLEWVDQTGGGGGTTNYDALSNKPQIAGVELSGDKSLHDLGIAAESAIPDVSGFYTKPASGIPASDIADGVIPTVHNVPAGGSVNQVLAKNSGTDYDLKWVNQSGGGGGAEIDDTAGEGDTTVVWSADKTWTENEALKEAIETKPDIKVPSQSSSDLYICDADGNVIMELKDGHVVTKNFDSSKLTEQDTKLRTRMEFGAHNGAEYYAPECSIPAFRIAGEQGWEWAWIAGIQFSSDGTMYVMHDDTVDRTTDGTGTISELTDTYINSLHIDQTGAGYNLSDFSQAELIVPTFEQILQICVKYNIKMVIRLNKFPNEYETASAIAKWDGLFDLLKAYNVPEESLCFYITTGFAGNLCRTHIGNNVCLAYFAGKTGTAQDALDWFEEKSLTGNLAHIIHIDNVNLTSVKLLHTNGVKAFAYEGIETDIATCATIGVDVFQNGRYFKLPN